jgi:hypothetical protein
MRSCASHRMLSLASEDLHDIRLSPTHFISLHSLHQKRLGEQTPEERSLPTAVNRSPILVIPIIYFPSFSFPEKKISGVMHLSKTSDSRTPRSQPLHPRVLARSDHRPTGGLRSPCPRHNSQTPTCICGNAPASRRKIRISLPTAHGHLGSVLLLPLFSSIIHRNNSASLLFFLYSVRTDYSGCFRPCSPGPRSLYDTHIIRFWTIFPFARTPRHRRPPRIP